MAIPKGYKTNFNTLCRARDNRDLALMECQDRATQQPCYVICAMGRDGEEIVMSPLARLFDGNPYDELNPPDPKGGFIQPEASDA